MKRNPVAGELFAKWVPKSSDETLASGNNRQAVGQKG